MTIWQIMSPLLTLICNIALITCLFYQNKQIRRLLLEKQELVEKIVDLMRENNQFKRNLIKEDFERAKINTGC